MEITLHDNTGFEIVNKYLTIKNKDSITDELPSLIIKNGKVDQILTDFSDNVIISFVTKIGPHSIKGEITSLGVMNSYPVDAKTGLVKSMSNDEFDILLSRVDEIVEQNRDFIYTQRQFIRYAKERTLEWSQIKLNALIKTLKKKIWLTIPLSAEVSPSELSIINERNSLLRRGISC